jgi:hypothetical protein
MKSYTKSEYRAYINSPDWRQRRNKFLDRSNGFCQSCKISRWLAVLLYDQDFHVHHKSYENVGREKHQDLEALCKRCHEIQTFGKSEFHLPFSVRCKKCKQWPSFDYFDRLCEGCSAVAALAGELDGPKTIGSITTVDSKNIRDFLDSVDSKKDDDEAEEEAIR